MQDCCLWYDGTQDSQLGTAVMTVKTSNVVLFLDRLRFTTMDSDRLRLNET